MESPYGLVYGPHESLRLGLSLGIDLAPMTCTFDCVYCERGRTILKIQNPSQFHSMVCKEEFIRELGVDVLGQAGYTVFTASNGEQALKVYRREQKRVDLVILDLIMPGMGGSKCLEELLKIDPQVQVLIASGYSPDASTKGALETGAKGFINKPYDTRKLLELVRKILDRIRG